MKFPRWFNEVIRSTLLMGRTGCLNIRPRRALFAIWIFASAGSPIHAQVVPDGGTRTLAVWNNRAGMFVGHAGPGNQLAVSNGGRVIGSNTVLGVLSASSNNLVRVSGVSSVWSDLGNFTVGQVSRTNRLEVRDGGRLYLTSGDVGKSLGSDGNEVSTLTLVRYSMLDFSSSEILAQLIGCGSLAAAR